MASRGMYGVVFDAKIRSGQVLMEEIRIQGSRLLHLDVRHQKRSPSQLSVDQKKEDAD
jgi:hypothetical protein